MTTFNYAEMAALAVELLTEFGADVTFSVTPAGVYAGGTNTVGAPTGLITKGALFDFRRDQTSTEPGGLIQVGDKRLLMASTSTSGVAIVPTLKDRVIANGVEFTIKGIGEVNPAGTSVVYDMHVRSA